MLVLRLAIAALDFVNGVWSGFPLCCVWAYTWAGLCGARAQARDFARRCVRTSADVERYRRFDYVPCPDCFHKGRVVARQDIRKGCIPVGWLHRRLGTR